MRFVPGFVRVLLVALLCVSAAVWAQTTGSITGTVLDGTGAVVSNAQVTVSDATKGITRTSTTNGQGEYLAAGLGQGSYDITVTATGFKKYEAKGVVLDVAQKSRVDVTMEIGAVGTEIIVEGTTVAQVETQASELSGVVTGKEISQLELKGRNFAQLVTIVPGVSNRTGQDEAGVGVGGSVAFSVNGGRAEYNNWELDGGDNMDNGSNTSLNVYPSIEAISEVKVLTSSYGAQYGRSGSGTVEVETKSGTNKFHGNVYEFNRNTIFNARNYFNNPPNVNPGYHKNDYGYTIGGPLYIPGIYNKNKDKTYFFWSQEWRKDIVAGSPTTIAVPTAQERTGDFSGSLGSVSTCPTAAPGQQVPFSRAAFPDCPSNIAFGPSGQTFPGNQVPVDTVNSVPLLALIPLPTVVGTRNNSAAPSLPTNWREELVRVDHDINSKTRLTFRYIHDSWDQIWPSPLWTAGTSFPTIQTNFKGPGVGLVARLSASVTPTLLNEFVFSYTTDHIVLTPVGPWKRPATMTFGLYNNGFGGGKLPGISLGGSSLFNFGEDVGYLPGPYNSNPTYTYRDNVIKIVGRHNLQFGAYFVAAQKNELGAPGVSTNGTLSFSASNQTVSTGNAFADLLAGRVASFGQQSANPKFYNRYKIFEPYFQDDWHVTQRLTLNLGLRVSMFGTYRERTQKEYSFDPAAFVAGASSVDTTNTVIGNAFNGIVQCGGKGGSVPGIVGAVAGGNSNAGCMKGHLFNPAPRVGFAWDPWGDGKTAIRGGYGVFFEHTNGNEANTESLESAASPLSTTISISNPVGGYAGIVPQPPGSTSPFSTISIPNKAIWPYMQQWHLDVQREVVRNTVAMVSYVGSKGTHLTRQTDINQVRPTPLSQNPYAAGEVINAVVNGVAHNDCGTTFDQWSVPTNATTSLGQPIAYIAGVNGGPPSGPAVNLALATGCVDSNGVSTQASFFRPYQGLGGILRLDQTSSSSYNSLQAAVRRSVGALQLTLAYTLSHSIDDSSTARDGRVLDTYNPRAARGNSSFDQRHLFSFAYVYDLPFFKNPGLSKTLLGGWQLSGITTFQTGAPLSIANGGNGLTGVSGDNAGVGNTVVGGSRPDKAGNPSSNTPNIPVAGFGPLLFNPSAYVQPRGLTFGTTPDNSVYGPKRTNFDMALFKHFAIKESVSFEFRAEAFNLFNHREWNTVGTSIGCYGTTNNSAGDASCIGTPGNPNTNNTYLRPNSTHDARLLQMGAKFIF